MSVQRIESGTCGSYGYQARVHVLKGVPRLTKFFADDQHGGKRAAKRAALAAEQQLQRKAKRLRRQLIA